MRDDWNNQGLVNLNYSFRSLIEVYQTFIISFIWTTAQLENKLKF